MTLPILQDAAQQHVISRNNPNSPVDVTNIFLAGVLSATEATAGTGTSGAIFRGTPVMGFGSIDSTDTPENIAAEDLTRSYLEVINTSASGTFWINFGADADNTAAVCIPIVAGGSWSSPPNWCPTGRVFIAGTASDTYSIITA